MQISFYNLENNQTRYYYYSAYITGMDSTDEYSSYIQSRRRFLGIIGLSTALTLAGCTGDDNDDEGELPLLGDMLKWESGYVMVHGGGPITGSVSVTMGTSTVNLNTPMVLPRTSIGSAPICTSSVTENASRRPIKQVVVCSMVSKFSTISVRPKPQNGRHWTIRRSICSRPLRDSSTSASKPGIPFSWRIPKPGFHLAFTRGVRPIQSHHQISTVHTR